MDGPGTGMKDGNEAHRPVSGSGRRHQAAMPVLLVVCAIGLFCIIRAVFDPSLEWRALAMVALAIALAPMRADVRIYRGGEPIRISLSHSVFFAGALALGPVGAPIPAVFGAIARILLDKPMRGPIHEILYATLRPAAVCAAASLVYVGTGGSGLCPHGVDSFYPMLCAAAVYVIANCLLMGVRSRGDSATKHESAVPRLDALVVAWTLCLVGGYIGAILYALAPPYVLLVPAAAFGAAALVAKKPARELVDSRTRESADSPTSELQTFVDPATGLANQRYLDMFLARELSRSERAKMPLSVAVFDLERSGKQLDADDRTVEDEALAHLGASLKSGLRDYDLVARYSSGRLAVVLPEASIDEAFDVIDRLHASIVSTDTNGISISVSVGIATFPEHGANADELINSAHHALNTGRLSGPNRVHTPRRLAEAS